MDNQISTARGFMNENSLDGIRPETCSNYTYFRITNPRFFSLYLPLPTYRPVKPNPFSHLPIFPSFRGPQAKPFYVFPVSFIHDFFTRKTTFSRITVSATFLCQPREWQRKTILYLAEKSEIPFSILWPVTSHGIQ